MPCRSAIELGLAVVSRTALSIDPARLDCQITEKMMRMGGKAGLVLGALDRLSAQVLRFIEPAEDHAGPPQRLICPGAMTDDARRRVALQQLLTLSHPCRCLAGVADLR